MKKQRDLHAIGSHSMTQRTPTIMYEADNIEDREHSGKELVFWSLPIAHPTSVHFNYVSVKFLLLSQFELDFSYLLPK